MFAKTISATLLSVVVSQNTTSEAGDLRNFKNMQSMYSYLSCGKNNVCRKELRNAIQDYGCYCMPGNSLQVRGSNLPAVDPIDEVCQTLHKAWTCVEMDGRQGLNGLDANCHRDAIEEDSYGQFKWFGEEVNGERKIVCGTKTNREYANTSDPQIACKKAACNVERAFVYNMIDAEFETYLDEQFRSMASSGACDVAPLGAGVADMCCGNYPTRFPHQSTNRQCCGTQGRAYTLGQMTECCSDGEIRLIGSC